MTETMRAVVLDQPGPPEALTIRRLPLSQPTEGQVRLKVMAAGLNRSELHTRLGLAEGVVFPRVLGIEATGIVDACPGGEFSPGQQVMTMMGGMGRTFDGGYAEFTVVPAGQVIPFTSSLDWATLGAVPEMLQTAYGSLTVGLDARSGQSVLIRGGEAADLPREVLQEFPDDVAAGRAIVPLYRAFSLDEIADAHAIMEAGKATGKLVVLPHGE